MRVTGVQTCALPIYYDVSYDDMETDDYDAMWSLADQDAEYEAYLDSIVTE
jgi:hypothetical protein